MKIILTEIQFNHLAGALQRWGFEHIFLNGYGISSIFLGRDAGQFNHVYWVTVEGTPTLNQLGDLVERLKGL